MVRTHKEILSTTQERTLRKPENQELKKFLFLVSLEPIFSFVRDYDWLISVDGSIP
jgi:hypothetical protein